MEEIKVVITIKGSRGTIGVQSPDCDPVLCTFDGGLERALELLPAKIEEANRQWDSNPRYPKCRHELKQPAPQPVQRTTSSTTTSQQSSQYQQAFPGL